MHNTQFVLFILVGGSALYITTAYPNGAVTDACDSMRPIHGSHVPNTDVPPYTVTSSSSTYTEGQRITVTLRAEVAGFRGFLLQARDTEGGAGPLGTFSVTGDEAQLLLCGGVPDSAVSHKSRLEKMTVNATWTAPPPTRDNMSVEFRATFVQNVTQFWVGVRSNRVEYNGTMANATTVMPPYITTPNSGPSISLVMSLLYVLPLLTLL